MQILDGSILRIDLSKKKIIFEKYKKYKKFLGGRAINQYIIFKELPLGISPFDPSNLLAVGAGILSGTKAPGSCRVNIDTKNVLTGGIGSSNAGGSFAPEMRLAGINNIIITGKAKDLVYLLLDGKKIEIKDAKHLQKKTTSETEKIIKEEAGDDFQIMCIGPAGENLVRSACVVVNGAKVAGRCGTGAVMGSKNLKAVAVRGSENLEPHDPKRFEKVVEKCTEKLTKSEYLKLKSKYGVYCVSEPWGIESPYRNFSGKVPSLEKKNKILRDAFLQYQVGTKACCKACPVPCWALYEIEENGKRTRVEALQINDIHNFGARLDMFDPKLILKAHKLCNDLGLDEDNACGSIAWAFECYEKGLLTQKDTDGMDLTWGNSDAIFELFKKIAYREGFGALLAEGCKRASEKIGRGTEKCCVHVKGQDLFEILWASPSWALGTVVSPRGGTHTRGAVKFERMGEVSDEIYKKLFGISPLDNTFESMISYKHKEKLVVFFERLEAAVDCLGLCYFMHGLSRVDLLLPQDFSDLLSSATGLDISPEKLLWIGERTHTLEKSFNVLHTPWTKQDDFPPQRFVEIPLDGKFKVDLDKWEKMLNRYYELHKWDTKTGNPTKKRLEQLNLKEIADKLIEQGKL
jgi:aldehyde:ferredoxin oxidoreductase